MAFDGRMNIVEIADDEKTVYFDTYRTRKISGTKIGGILGYSEFATPFKVALEIAAISPGDKANRYIDAGINIEETVSCHTDTVFIVSESDMINAYSVLTKCIQSAEETVGKE